MLRIVIVIAVLLGSVINLSAQSEKEKQEWKLFYQKTRNTQEADMIIRHGDIDNLGFGWAPHYSPFSGAAANAHPFPWKRDTTDVLGFDMTMVCSSFNPDIEKKAHHGSHHKPNLSDSYSKEKKQLLSRYGKSMFSLNLKQEPDKDIQVKKVMLQFFMDDCQPYYTGAVYKIYINGKRALFAEGAFNSMRQKAHTGKLLSIVVDDAFTNEFMKNELNISIDDSTSGSADGFAIDFLRVLYNPKNLPSGSVDFRIKDVHTHLPLAGATLFFPSTAQYYTTDSMGFVKVENVPCGDVTIEIKAKGYPTAWLNTDLRTGEKKHESILMSDTDAHLTNFHKEVKHHGLHNTKVQMNLGAPATKQSANGNLPVLKIGGK